MRHCATTTGMALLAGVLLLSGCEQSDPGNNNQQVLTGTPGSTCACDTDCNTHAGHPGICVWGECMLKPSSECSEPGSTLECPFGTRCHPFEDRAGGACVPECQSFLCKGACDQSGLCQPTMDMSCSMSCGTQCTCQPGECPGDEECVDGECRIISLTEPGPGPGPTCTDLPPLMCDGTSSHCGELVYFDPEEGPGYWNMPINGESSTNQYRSFLRRDLMMLVKYAAAKVDCKTKNWRFGNNGPLGLYDMSEADGAIPGTSVNQPGHPEGTHTDGYDIDISYYRLEDNDGGLVCEHTINGVEQYHCTEVPDNLEHWRTALFLAYLNEHPSIRVIGVDGKVGPLVEDAMQTLCDDGWAESTSCSRAISKLAYEETDQGWGWFRFHHHHFHVSFSAPSYKSRANQTDGAVECLVPGCHPEPLRTFLTRYGL